MTIKPQLKLVDTEVNSSFKRIELMDQYQERYCLELNQGEFTLYDYEAMCLHTSIPVEFIPFITQLLTL